MYFPSPVVAMHAWNCGADAGRSGLPSHQVPDHSHRPEAGKRADDGRQQLREATGWRGGRTAEETRPEIAGRRR